MHRRDQRALVADLGQAPGGDDGGRRAVAFAGQGGGQDLLGQRARQGAVADQRHQLGQAGRGERQRRDGAAPVSLRWAMRSPVTQLVTSRPDAGAPAATAASA